MPRSLLTFVVTAMCIAAPFRLTAQTLQSGIFQTAVGSMVEECGDQIQTGSGCSGFPNIPGRFVPFSATISLDVDSAVPMMSATIHDAVFEGGDPFELQLEATGVTTAQGYRFVGDYFPSIPGYVFDWEFSAASGGAARLDGNAYWSGGHWWQLEYDAVSMVAIPEPCAWTALSLLLLTGAAIKRQARRP